MEKISLEKIGEFSVIDRDLGQVLEDMGIEESEIDKFQRDGRVLNIGSGLYQKFEKELHDKRNDLKIISVDPALGIDIKDITNGDWYIEKLNEATAQYKQKDKPKLQWGKDMAANDPEEFQKQRLEKINSSNSRSVAALAPQLPFKSESLDVIMDCVASMRYLNDENSRREYLRSICDLLNPGGSAYITSLRKNELEFVDENFQVELLREYKGANYNNPEGCDVKITKKKDKDRAGRSRVK